MRREFNRQLVIWPSLATATIIALMWITSPGNPFAKSFSSRTTDVAVNVAATPWTTEGARDALRRLEESLRRSWDDESRSPWAGVEPIDRPERGSRGMKLPARVAEAFGVDDDVLADDQPISLPAPVFDEHRELAGMANPVARQPIFKLRVPGSDLLMPTWAIENRTLRQSDSVGIVGDDLSDSFAADTNDVNEFGSSTESDEEMDLNVPSLVPAINVASRDQSSNSSSSISGQRMIPEEEIAGILELFQVSKDGLASSLQPTEAANDPIESSAEETTLAEPTLAESTPSIASAIPESVRNLGRPSSRSTSLDDSISEPVADEELAYDDFDQRFTAGKPGGWPVAVVLDQQLAKLTGMNLDRGTHFIASSRTYVGDLGMVGRDFTAKDLDALTKISTWSQQVAETMRQLRLLQRIGDAEAEPLLDELTTLAETGKQQAELVTDREVQIEWLRAVHGLSRRVAVWQPVWNIASGKSSSELSISSRTSADVQDAIADINDEIHGTGDEDGWRRFLLLDEIEAASLSTNANERMVVAQRLLSRFHWHNLSDDQRAWMHRDSIARLAESVRPWASSAIDYSQLVAQIERQESGALDMAGIDIADAVQTLRFAASTEAKRLSSELNQSYRNANVRLAISTEMLRRFLPDGESKVVPLNTEILGSQVHGYSNIASNLDIRLVPTRDRWVIQLQTLGQVQTDSVGVKSGVAVRTAGNAMFNASTPITISPHRVSINDTTVDVQSQSRLRNIKSDYDGWPLIGSLVRSVAATRYEEMQGQAKSISDHKVRQQVSQEIDERVDEQLTQSTSRFGQAVLGPLSRLELDPMVIDMETTNERLIARYRLAGDWQLAAFTPRPRAPRTSLLSVQMHQSAINNTIEQLVPRDQPQTIADVIRNGSQIFGFDLSDTSEDLPTDVMIQFSQTRPITVEIQDGQVWVTLRVVQLSRGQNLDLRRFIVRAVYVPQLDGINASLVRDGHLRISGPSLSMRERLPVRAIFNKVLSPNRTIPIVLPQLSQHPAAEGLAVSQLELRDGWLALAISEAEHARVAIVTPRVAEETSNR